MLHKHALPRRERDREHVLSITSLSEPEPNRQLKLQKSSSAIPKTSPSSPPPGSVSPNQRITQTQHAVASRKLAQFMNSILIRPLPRCIFAPPLVEPIVAVDELKCAANAYEPSTLDVLSCFEELLMAPSRIPGLESEDFQDEQCDRSFGCLEDSSVMAPSVSEPNDDYKPSFSQYAEPSGLGSQAERPSNLSCPVSLTDLPNEIILAIFGFVSDKQELLVASRVCQMFRSAALSESFWSSSLSSFAVQCGIQSNLLHRSDSMPSYLRWCAINRWSQRYEEAKRLLAKLAPENRASIEEKEQFEGIFAAMMPNVSPWSPSAYSTDEIVLKLPGSISVLPLNDMNALQVFVELDSGAHKHELTSKGLSPVLEFIIYNPSSAKPTISCKTNDIYHPLLEQSSKQLFLPPNYYTYDADNTNPATSIRLLILAIRDCFTRFESIVSDFTL